MRPFLVLFAVLFSQILSAEPLHFNDLNDRTLVPVEIQTRDIKCNREKLIAAALDQDLPRELFQGTYRVYNSNNVNSSSIGDGLNFILSGTTSCEHNTYNAISIIKSNLKTGTITIRQLELTVKDFDRSDLRNQERVEEIRTGTILKKKNPADVGFANQFAPSENHNFAICPWTNIQSVTAESPAIELNCTRIERPVAEKVTIETQIKRMLGLEAQPPKNPLANSRMDQNPNTMAAYDWQKDFALPVQRGFEPTGATIPIDAYLVCRDQNGQNVMAFAVMAQHVRGKGYLCN